MAKKKFPTKRMILPEGIARFAHIQKPDEGNDQVAGDGKYKVDVVVAKDQLAGLKRALDQLGHEAHGTGFAGLFLPVKRLKEDDPLADTHVALRCKSRYQPSVVDERGQPDETARVYGGDTVAVEVTLSPYPAGPMTEGKPGIAFMLNHVQRLAKGGDGGSASSPFAGRDVTAGEQEESYAVVDDEPAAAPAAVDCGDEPPF